MKWEKKGLIFKPSEHALINGCREFAQSPQTLVFEDFVRIYFSTRKYDESNGKYLSFISFVDFDKRLDHVLNVASEPVIELGSLGTFDEHGIFPINILKHNGKILAYTCGWSRRVSVSVETSTGLAYSENDGLSFNKMGPGPVLTSSLKEPVLVGDSFVRVYDGVFHMWYIFGQRWLESNHNEPEARVYKIAHATSVNGIDWVKEEGVQIIPDYLNADECQALPSVIKIKERYHMYFCFRYATDFRRNPNRGYRIGYAWSDDLVVWNREDRKSGIDVSNSGWDSEMMCYPHVFQSGDDVFMLYNGNEFGRFGFGLAKLQM